MIKIYTLITLLQAYARFLLCDIFWTEIMRLSTTFSRNLATVLEQLAELYLVYWALEKYGDLLLVTICIFFRELILELYVTLQKRSKTGRVE